jgi:hypothetical protein
VESATAQPTPGDRLPPPGDLSVAREGPGLPRYRRSHPGRAFAWMVLPMLAAPLILFVPFLGWVLLLVLLPIEFGRIGGRRISRGDALWVAIPSSLAVSAWEIGLMVVVLGMVPGFDVRLDLLGSLIVLGVIALNGFFYSVGAMSTSFDSLEPVPPEAFSGAAP